MNIEPSTGYITISQKNLGEGDDFIRAKIPAKSSLTGTANNVIIQGSTVKVILDDYIFDRGNTTYIIKIDDDFVEVNGQNLIGDSWEVLTGIFCDFIFFFYLVNKFTYKKKFFFL
jgi:hypothetical protein